MRALTFNGTGSIRFESVPDPEIIHPGDAIVKVSACAICGSDLHVFHGREKGMDEGTAMGHEFAGEIVEVGDELRSLQKGDRVMSPFTTSCGSCYYCTVGLTCRCTQGQLFGWREKEKGLHGGQAEYIRVPLAASTLVRIPEGVSTEEALLLGDVLSTGFYCARQAEVHPGGVYVVVGCGPVGLMAILGAVESGAEKIIALDSVPGRLAMAKQFGAIPLNVSEDGTIDQIRALTHGRGADGVMEAVGSKEAVRMAIASVRPGGIIASVGVCNDEYMAFSPVEAYDKNLTYRIGRCPARFMMDQLVPLVVRKKYGVAAVFSHRMKLSDGAAGYELFSKKQDGCTKVLLEP
ncbi:MAG: alcohol dehydrogenase catalytic domain-containing protein [Cytophagales bacterium]|nr:alcohol dehydrogenase catalytic domain-containing protein [Cytophagales bacterium]